jgi:hypothetical protein
MFDAIDAICLRRLAERGNSHGWLGNPTDKKADLETGWLGRPYPWDCQAIRGSIFKCLNIRKMSFVEIGRAK